MIQKLLALLLIVAFGTLWTHDIATAHGGTYRGAGDNVPGGGGASGGGGGGGGGGSAPVGGGSGGSGGGSATSPSRSGGGSGGATPSSPATSSAPGGTDLTTWQVWWGFNRDTYLNLRGAIHRSDLLLGSDDFFLGNVPMTEARDLLKPSEAVIRERIVPALERVLIEERDNDIVTGALIALAKIGDGKAALANDAGASGAQRAADASSGEGRMAKTIQPFLADANQEIAETAAVALGILANESSLPILTDVLRDSKRGRELASPQRSTQQTVHWRTRAFAAYGLGLIGYRSENETVRREIVRSLAAMVDGEAQAMATPDVAVACLISMGLIPLPVDLDYLPQGDDTPPPDRCRQAQIEWVLALLERGNLNHLVRAHATTALARLVARVPDDWGLRKRASERLMAAIAPYSSESREVRASAVLALGRIGGSGSGALDRSVRASLVKAFTDAREPDVRNFALVALAHVAARPGPGGTDPLEGMKETQAFLLKELAKGSTTDRPWIVLALGVLDRGSIDLGVTRSPEIGAAVRAALKDARSPRDVGACAIAVGIRDDAESRAELVAKLGDVSDDETRGFVALALGLMGARDAIGRIQDIVSDAKYRPALLKDASISLGLLGDKQAVPGLIRMLVDAKSLATQASLASALGFIGDARSIEPLVEMLGDKKVTPRARAFAAVALGLVADKESLPWNSKLSVGINYRANTTTLANGEGTGILEIL